MWIEDLRFAHKLRRLQKAEVKIYDAFRPELDKANAEKNWDEEQSIASLMFFEADMVKSEIRTLQHKYVKKQAEQLLLPIPPFDEKSGDWHYSDVLGTWSLSTDVLARLGREVRQERRERLELVFLWPSSLIGLVGGLAGIFSMFYK